MNILPTVEVVSFSAKHSKATGRVTGFLKSSKHGNYSFDTTAIVSGMHAEPLLVTNWFNDHLFVKYPNLREKLVAQIEKKQNLERAKKYEDCSQFERDLIIFLSSFHIYEGETDITITGLMRDVLDNLQKLGYLNYVAADISTANKKQINTAYVVQFLV